MSGWTAASETSEKSLKIPNQGVLLRHRVPTPEDQL
jgi:hypothetical protein